MSRSSCLVLVLLLLLLLLCMLLVEVPEGSLIINWALKPIIPFSCKFAITIHSSCFIMLLCPFHFPYTFYYHYSYWYNIITSVYRVGFHVTLPSSSSYSNFNVLVLQMLLLATLLYGFFKLNSNFRVFEVSRNSGLGTSKMPPCHSLPRLQSPLNPLLGSYKEVYCSFLRNMSNFHPAKE